MDAQEQWEKALRETEIVRPRVKGLLTFEDTQLPYVFLAESALNMGDTVVRQGEVTVEKPAIVLPPDFPQFEGFRSEDEPAPNLEALTQFLFFRGIRFPSMKYQNKTHSLDLREGKLKESIAHYLRQFEEQENVSTGLVIGPEECWQFSVLIFIAGQVMRQAGGDIEKLLEKFRRKNG